MKKSAIKFCIGMLYATTLCAESTNVTCTNLLNVVNSPSVLDSPCSVPFKKILLEFNYIDQQLVDHFGAQQTFPNSEVRIGLPANNEFYFYPPNYISQRTFPGSGFTTTAFGVKHSINYNSKWLFALEAIGIPTTGSYNYGTQRVGGILRGIANYTINAQWAAIAMLGISRFSNSKLGGGEAFNSVNPDVLLSYSPSSKVSFYGEVYGQSSIGVGAGAGFNFDGGVLVLITPHSLFNISAGQQLYNYLGSFKHYINFGGALMLDW